MESMVADQALALRLQGAFDDREKKEWPARKRAMVGDLAQGRTLEAALAVFNRAAMATAEQAKPAMRVGAVVMVAGIGCMAFVPWGLSSSGPWGVYMPSYAFTVILVLLIAGAIMFRVGGTVMGRNMKVARKWRKIAEIPITP